MAVDLFTYTPTLETPLVKVTSTDVGQEYNITWPAQPNVEGYRVYAGFDPLHIRSLVSGYTALDSSQLGFTFDAPTCPPGQQLYFWAASTGVSGSTGPEDIQFIEDIGSTVIKTIQANRFNQDTNPMSDSSIQLMESGDSLYYIEEMRRRAKAILEDTGEDVILFIKQWRGLPDPTTQEELGMDPSYQGMDRSSDTYGAGFYPGYFPGIGLRMRFGGLPTSMYENQAAGMRPLLDNESWTLWDPLLHENDFIIRVATGQRYTVRQTAYSNYRTVPITQRLTLAIVEPTSPLTRMTSDDLWDKWRNIDVLKYNRVGWNLMPSSDPKNVDYLIFK